MPTILCPQSEPPARRSAACPTVTVPQPTTRQAAASPHWVTSSGKDQLTQAQQVFALSTVPYAALIIYNFHRSTSYGGPSSVTSEVGASIATQLSITIALSAP